MFFKNDKGYKDEILSLLLFQTAMDANGLGLAQLKLRDSEWKKLTSELDIDYYNQTARKQHKIQAIGYWVATATALFSLAITLIG